jgi:ketosteroid isomerase-like protein
MARSTEQVFQDHMKALLNGDFPALMADYADDAILMTPEGANVGKAAIQGYFINALSALPNAKLSPTGHIVQGDLVLFTWIGVSDVATIPHGVDTFVIRDDKIRLQTVWLTIAPK